MEVLVKEVQNKMSKIDFENIVVTEKNVKDTKKLRTSVRKEFNQLEEARKDFERAYREPLDELKQFYDKEIAKIYKSADSQLRTLIVENEDKQKQEKEDEVKAYFEELKEVENLDFLKYESLNIKVNLSSSINKLKEEVSDKVDQIKADLDLIDTQEHKERILAQYQQTLDVNKAITTVLNQVALEKQIQEYEKEKKNNELEIKIMKKLKKKSCKNLSRWKKNLR